MLRVEVEEAGQASLPAIDVDEAAFVIGSSPAARVRLPAGAAVSEHVRIDGNRWRAVGEVRVDGEAHDGGDIGDGVTLAIGGYRVRLAPAPPGAVATSPQRTESLARELMRSLLGSGSAPSLEVERGPVAGVRKALAPPESVLVIGRGDEAGWILLDEDLSRAHAEVRRGWDGMRIVDLGSKNGTKVDGVSVGAGGAVLHDGSLVELGKVALRFRDPAEQHLRGTPAADAAVVAPPQAPATPTARVEEAEPPKPRPSTGPFYAAIAILVCALAGLVWTLSL